MTFAESRVVHVKVDLSEADAYDDLFPPSMFTESAGHISDIGLLSKDTLPGDGQLENVNNVDEAFVDVEEVISPFAGKTKVYVA